MRLREGDARRRNQCRRSAGADDHRPAIPAHELAQPVPGRRPLGEDRETARWRWRSSASASAVAYRPAGAFGQRLENDRVQVPGELLRQTARRHSSRCRGLVGHVRARPERVRGENGLFKLGGRFNLQPVRARPDQDLEEDDAERVDVAGDGQRLSPAICSGLAYSGVNARPLDRVSSVSGARSSSAASSLAMPKSRSSGLAVGRDQDVRRLEVAVDDEVGVRVLPPRRAPGAKSRSRPARPSRVLVAASR